MGTFRVCPPVITTTQVEEGPAPLVDSRMTRDNADTHADSTLRLNSCACAYRWTSDKDGVLRRPQHQSSARTSARRATDSTLHHITRPVLDERESTQREQSSECLTAWYHTGRASAAETEHGCRTEAVAVRPPQTDFHRTRRAALA